MNDFKSFIRYVIPGLSSIILLIVSLYLTNPGIFTNTIPLFNNKSNIALVIGVFFTSGAWGFILANIYFSIIWSEMIGERFSIDHKAVLLNYQDTLQIYERKLNKYEQKDINSLSKRKAWELVLPILFTKASSENEKLKKMLDNMTDMLHSIGGFLVGLISSFIIWLLILILGDSDTNLYDKNFNIALYINSFIIIAVGFNYRNTLKSVQSLLNSIIAQEIDNSIKGEKEKKKEEDEKKKKKIYQLHYNN